jgi:signal transduction histidine kinase
LGNRVERIPESPDFARFSRVSQRSSTLLEFQQVKLAAHREKFVALLVLLPLLAAAVGLAARASGEAEEAARQRFDFKISETKFAIRQRLLAYEQVLRGAVGLFAASDDVSRDEWHVYVRNLTIERYYPGIQGVGFSLRIDPERKAAHVAAVRAEGFSGYAIRPDGERAVYTSIVYLEPFDWRNQRAFGYDMFAEPVRRTAMEQARDTGLAVVSGKVTLVQETAEAVQHGFLMYMPIYPQGAVPATVEERRAGLVGYVYTPFRMDDLMLGILGREALPDIALSIYDGRGLSPDALMYDSEGDKAAGGAFSATETLDLNGHEWTLRFASLPAFDAGIDRRLPRLIFGAGTVISILFAAVAWSLAVSRRRALALAAANRGLQAEVAERTRAQEQLARARDLAEAANRAKSTFLANMSHELRTPLNAVIGFSEALDERLFGDLNERQARYVKNIHTAGRHLLSLINDVLDLSKVEAGRMELDVTEFDLPATLKHALMLVQEQALQNRIALTLDIDPALGTVRADERKVKQILVNLLSNAVKFTLEGGSVRLSARRADGAVEIAIADTGIGIGAQHLEAIFQEFVQVRRADGAAQEGTGLGLALSKKFVELHGGRIHARSEPGKGSTFVFTLPERQ